MFANQVVPIFPTCTPFLRIRLYPSIPNMHITSATHFSPVVRFCLEIYNVINAHDSYNLILIQKPTNSDELSDYLGMATVATACSSFFFVETGIQLVGLDFM